MVFGAYSFEDQLLRAVARAVPTTNQFAPVKIFQAGTTLCGSATEAYQLIGQLGKLVLRAGGIQIFLSKAFSQMLNIFLQQQKQ